MDRVTLPCPNCRFALPLWAVGKCPNCKRSLDGPDTPGPAGTLAPMVTSGFTSYPPPGSEAMPSPAMAPPGWPPPPPPPPARGRAGAVVAVVVVALLAVAVLAVGVVAVGQRQEAMASPARPVIAEPCAQYREISIRLAANPDAQAAGDAVAWMQANVSTFDQAAAVDPDLAPAAAAVHWLHDLFNDPTLMARTSMEEIDGREAPLKEACVTGPGRA